MGRNYGKINAKMCLGLFVAPLGVRIIKNKLILVTVYSPYFKSSNRNEIISVSRKISLSNCDSTLWCLVNVPYLLTFRNFWLENGQILPSNGALSKLYYENYFLRQNAYFRPCLAPLWGLLLEITKDPFPSIKTSHPIYQARKSI